MNLYCDCIWGVRILSNIYIYTDMIYNMIYNMIYIYISYHIYIYTYHIYAYDIYILLYIYIYYYIYIYFIIYIYYIYIYYYILLYILRIITYMILIHDGNSPKTLCPKMEYPKIQWLQTRNFVGESPCLDSLPSGNLT